MKYIKSIAFIICLFFVSIQSQWIPSPVDTFFAFDIDEVLSKKSLFLKPHLILSGMLHSPFNSHNWISFLMHIKNSYKTDSHEKKQTLYDDSGNIIDGLTFHLLYHGMKRKNLAFYVPFTIKSIENLLTPIDGTVAICRYLKNQKGYTIVFATNKDRLSYDAFAKTSGRTLIDIPETVFVAQTGNNKNFLNQIKTFIQEKDVPDNYKRLAHKALTIQSTEHIIHIPHSKPNPEYYTYILNHIPSPTNKKNMIFIDDQQKNINGVNALRNDYTVFGIRFKNPYQLTQELINLGVLSKKEDQIFLQKMKQYK
jgi:FMN phosphatase YigB (HAD superfamily)